MPDTFPQLMASLVENWSGGSSQPSNMVAMPGTGNLMAVGITEPCSLELLDSLTTYAKMRSAFLTFPRSCGLSAEFCVV